jgi:4-carboxymuconolactone decarboxylase
MRLPLIAPSELSPEQRPLYDDMRAGIEQNFAGFKTIADNGALMVPGIRGCTSRNSASRSGT